MVTACFRPWAQPWAHFYADSRGTCKPVEDKKAHVYTGFQMVSGTSRNAPEVLLFSDAESSENLAEKVIGGELTGDRAQRRLSQAEFLGEELELR